MRTINTNKKTFLWFLIMIVFFLYFLWNFYKSLERSINFPHDVMTEKLFCFFDPICMLLLWQNKNSYAKLRLLNNLGYVKIKLFSFITFFKILFYSEVITTWPRASSSRSKYWPSTLTLKILVLTDIVDQNTQTVNCKWLCC